MEEYKKFNKILKSSDPHFQELEHCFVEEADMINEIAKGIVLKAFRNGPLEDVHSFCIPDEVMKYINKYAVNEMYLIVKALLEKDTKSITSLCFLSRFEAPNWDDADLNFPDYEVLNILKNSKK